MTGLTLEPILRHAGIDLADALVIRHAYVEEHEDSGLRGIHADSTDAEILAYTNNQSASSRNFPATPPRFWVVFVREGGDRSRLWSVMESVRQRWSAYATNGHGGNVELRGLDPATFRYSLLRVFDPSTPTPEIDAAESHFKIVLDSRRHGLNRN